MEPDESSAVEAAAKMARRLLAEEPIKIEPVRGGGNNRLFRVETSTGAVVLKSYRLDDDDRWDRLAHEWAALSFLARHLGDAVPQPIAHDPQTGWAALEWIEGGRIAERRGSDVEAALAFTAALRALQTPARGETFTAAREACLALADLLAQIDWRLGRLEPVAASNAELQAFLADVRLQLALHRRNALERLDPTARLPITLQVLSPSDFGFHNALRRPSGQVVFLDFEYFGWDDPAKLACDVYWHPGMGLSDVERHLFMAGFEGQASADPGYRQRIALYLPLIGLRWCLILLNEFLTAGLARRRHAGQNEDAAAAQARQMAKARVLYRAIAHRI
jgi:hypothetical protein